MFIAALFTIAKTWKQSKCLLMLEMDKENVVYIEWNIIQPKKEGILPFVATCVDLEGIMLSEISQTEKDKYCMTSCVESKARTRKT